MSALTYFDLLRIISHIHKPNVNFKYIYLPERIINFLDFVNQLRASPHVLNKTVGALVTPVTYLICIITCFNRA